VLRPGKRLPLRRRFFFLRFVDAPKLKVDVRVYLYNASRLADQ
jgi:hypothetical protein